MQECRVCNLGYKVMIELQKKELVFDIKNTAAVYADSISSSVADSHSIHNIYDVGEDGNRDKLARILDSAVEDCNEMLFRYTKMKMLGGGFDSNELISGDTNITINLSLPSNYPLALKDALTSSIHDYIINTALMDWFIITNPNESKTYAELSVLAIKNLHEVFNRRERPRRTDPNA